MRIRASWRSGSPLLAGQAPPQQNYLHIPAESSQTHIAIAFRGAAYNHPDYFQLRGAVGVLSDGMSSRLFLEIRNRLTEAYQEIMRMQV